MSGSHVPRQCRSCGGFCGGGYHTAKTYRTCKAERRITVSLDIDKMAKDWHLIDKAVLADALKTIYAIRGEDTEVASIVIKALREGNVPGY